MNWKALRYTLLTLIGFLIFGWFVEHLPSHVVNDALAIVLGLFGITILYLLYDNVLFK